MKNIFLFIYRNHVFFIFLFLEFVCFSLTVRNNNFHRASFLNSSNQLTGNIYNLNHSIVSYFHLSKINEDLALENAALRSLLKQSQYSFKSQNIHVVDSFYLQHYSYVPAQVLNNSVGKRNNYLTINRGVLQGVEPEMAVISTNGVVGIVKDVSKNFASVISILNKNSSISARLEGAEYFGSLIWNGRNPQVAQLTDIPNHVTLSEGMNVVTSGFSSMFPHGIKIGKVRSFNIEPGANFYDIEVDLLTDMSTVNVVYVVNNLMRIEQKQLEKVTQEDE